MIPTDNLNPLHPIARAEDAINKLITDCGSDTDLAPVKSKLKLLKNSITNGTQLSTIVIQLNKIAIEGRSSWNWTGAQQKNNGLAGRIESLATDRIPEFESEKKRVEEALKKEKETLTRGFQEEKLKIVQRETNEIAKQMENLQKEKEELLKKEEEQKKRAKEEEDRLQRQIELQKQLNEQTEKTLQLKTQELNRTLDVLNQTKETLNRTLKLNETLMKDLNETRQELKNATMSSQTFIGAGPLNSNPETAKELKKLETFLTKQRATAAYMLFNVHSNKSNSVEAQGYALDLIKSILTDLETPLKDILAKENPTHTDEQSVLKQIKGISSINSEQSYQEKVESLGKKIASAELEKHPSIEYHIYKTLMQISKKGLVLPIIQEHKSHWQSLMESAAKTSGNTSALNQGMKNQ